MSTGNIAGKSNPGGRGTNVGIWTGRKKRINAEVALRRCPQGKLRALSSLRRVEEEKRRSLSRGLGGCADESNPRGRSELRPYKGES
jgi:hypothetical protein